MRVNLMPLVLGPLVLAEILVRVRGFVSAWPERVSSQTRCPSGQKPGQTTSRTRPKASEAGRQGPRAQQQAGPTKPAAQRANHAHRHTTTPPRETPAGPQGRGEGAQQGRKNPRPGPKPRGARPKSAPTQQTQPDRDRNGTPPTRGRTAKERADPTKNSLEGRTSENAPPPHGHGGKARRKGRRTPHTEPKGAPRKRRTQPDAPRRPQTHRTTGRTHL